MFKIDFYSYRRDSSFDFHSTTLILLFFASKQLLYFVLYYSIIHTHTLTIYETNDEILYIFFVFIFAWLFFSLKAWDSSKDFGENANNTRYRVGYLVCEWIRVSEHADAIASPLLCTIRHNLISCWQAYRTEKKEKKKIAQPHTGTINNMGLLRKSKIRFIWEMIRLYIYLLFFVYVCVGLYGHTAYPIATTSNNPPFHTSP